MTDPHQTERSSPPSLSGGGRASISTETRKDADRTHILTIARRWIGTPFHHRASLCGVGTDCLGLIRGIWRELYGEEPEPLPDYAPDWAEATGREDMLNAALRHLTPVDHPHPGDILLFRLRPNGPARHAGILSFYPSPLVGQAGRAGSPQVPAQTLIHAAAPHPVMEAPYTPGWQKRTTAAFAFP